MDKSLQSLCDALKKIIWELKPQHQALSFLLLTGKTNQGKTALLRQSSLQHVNIPAENSADIYYNQQGILVALDETWLNQSKTLLQHTLKELNRCHRALKISGIVLCVDINELLAIEPLQITEHSKAHAQLLHRFGVSLGYRVDAAVIFTKLDALAGFCEFFQYEHITELSKPLGFSLYDTSDPNQLITTFKTQFEQLIEMLGQQVIQKIHPARSSIKRTLIREFPLQLSSLRPAIQSLLQNISPRLFRIEAIYFTSAEQGGLSIDRLNKKIQHEYALTVQDTFPQATNYKSYFIEGALSALQAETKRQPPEITSTYKLSMGLLAGSVGLILTWLGYHYFQSTHLLDEASKELLAYENITNQRQNSAPALFHLIKASASLEKITSSGLSRPSIEVLKNKLHLDAKQHLESHFLPSLLAEVEEAMLDSKQSHPARYQALKIYLMLGNPKQYSEREVFSWFRKLWKKNSENERQQKMALIKQILRQPFQPLSINHHIVSDVRNYLNALPINYLYYSIAKQYFPLEKQAVTVDGFQLAHQEIPAYFTKAGFQKVLKQLPAISEQIQNDNWILARQDLTQLPSILKQAYCYEYATWWQNFIRRSRPNRFQDYQQARNLTQALYQSQAIKKLIDLIQEQTSPEFGDNSSDFNQEIASQFTSLNLLSQSFTQEVNTNISELDKFLTTLSVVNDQGKTAFNLTKARFMGDTLANPLTALYTKSRQLPEPLSLWIKQLADDAWFLLMRDSKNYINQQWLHTVFYDYRNQIANRYPFGSSKYEEVALADFDHFFSAQGVLNQFFEFYLKPFLDTSHPQWQPKQVDDFILPISKDTIDELIRANVITSMFFPNQSKQSHVEFTLQKLNLDPIVANLRLTLGNSVLYDDQNTDSFVQFSWPQTDAKLILNSIEGHRYQLEESGQWAFFKILQKVNVLADEQDSSSLQILFEINGNSGRYLLKTHNQINPFIPGILNGFTLNESIV